MLMPVALYLVAVNLWTLAAFRHDKRQAVAGHRRIAERDLLLLAAIGGSPGAFAGRHAFRHKTRKEPFSTLLQLIAAVQVGLAAGLLVLV
ncbi:DUF1294 domain-containing protein [Croceicoccus sp. BE223]|uniref:DUF1294 domain-containing protein n=1 Tax=Croceicoccus sp. BE223 TaxID=2817716 RepID=UPI00285C07D3|nr:DUF1294 domain-containing protein [Croceicoccus sp. BE223]MDR7101331.1 uncharacterized membrane protein YsdA (DUF1294 family) [Croceicoccus sp. BE223]